MKLWTIYLKLILTVILLLPASASYAQQRASVQGILTSQATVKLSISNLTQRGIEKLQLGDYLGAIADFDRALSLDSHNSLAYYYRGLAQRQLENSPSFQEAYLQARQIQGAARLQVGDEQEAIADFTYVLKHNPQATFAYINRGLARLESGEVQQAVTDFTAALNLEPNLATAYYHRSFAHHLLGNQEEALNDWNKAETLFISHSSTPAHLN